MNMLFVQLPNSEQVVSPLMWKSLGAFKVRRLAKARIQSESRTTLRTKRGTKTSRWSSSVVTSASQPTSMQQKQSSSPQLHRQRS